MCVARVPVRGIRLCRRESHAAEGADQVVPWRVRASAAVGVEQVGDNEPPVCGAHDVGRVVVQRPKPGQLLPGLFVDSADDVDEIDDRRGSLGDCLVEHDGFVLGYGPQPFHDL